ncbi:hypothetical protein ACFQ0B_80095 [Nonomuraea thailandensis]
MPYFFLYDSIQSFAPGMVSGVWAIGAYTPSAWDGPAISANSGDTEPSPTMMGPLYPACRSWRTTSPPSWNGPVQ